MPSRSYLSPYDKPQPEPGTPKPPPHTLLAPRPGCPCAGCERALLPKGARR